MAKPSHLRLLCVLLCALLPGLMPLTAHADEAPDTSPYRGKWTSGFRFLAVPEFGVGALYEFSLNIEQDRLSFRIRSAGDFFGNFFRGEDQTVDFKVLGWKSEATQPIGDGRITPESIISARLKATGVRDIVLNTSDVQKANAKKACGLTEWVAGKEKQIFGTRCIHGDPSQEMVVVMARMSGSLLMPIEEDAGSISASPDGEGGEDDDDSDVGIGFDFGTAEDPSWGLNDQIKSLNTNFPLHYKD